MPKLKRRIVRNKEKHDLELKTIRLSIEIEEYIRDEFREAVENNGKTMKDVLSNYMKHYVRKQKELELNRQKRSELSEG